MRKYVIISLLVSVGLLFARERFLQTNSSDLTIEGAKTIKSTEVSESALNREEIILFEQDFEGDVSDWNNGSGWELTELESYSPTHSFNSPNELNGANAGIWTLTSPVIPIPEIGGEEIMHFKFALKTDMPDSDGDDDTLLEDYYWVDIADADALAWHTSDFNAYTANSYWCGQEEESGYLDGWLQFLDSPEITIPDNSFVMKTQLKWGIESPAGAGDVSEGWIDGWDAANVRISTDGGATWDILIGDHAYDFYSGYGWVFNGEEDGTDGVHTIASGWGNQQGWHPVEFDLSAYAGETVIVRFAFGSDPAYSVIDDANLIGFLVDDVSIESNGTAIFTANADDEDPMTASGLTWVSQFYDYYDDGSETGSPRPGSLGWEEYLPGYPFCDGCNTYLDISEFAGKNVIFKFSSRYDEDDDGGNGTGIFIDDLTVYKESSANYVAPSGLEGEALNSQCNVWWDDMNLSGTDDFIYDNDDVTDGINLTAEGDAWAGEIINLVGVSTVNTVSIFSVNGESVDSKITAYGTVGAFFETDPMYEMDVTLVPGWNTFEVTGWDFEGTYIIATLFTDIILAGLDASASPSTNSVVMLGGGWDLWSTIAGGDLNDGEWGIRANITFDGANVTYNVYRDGEAIASDLTNASFSDYDVVNNFSYEYAVSATYDDGEESDLSDSIQLTPQADTVYELAYDDGSQESGFNAGSGNYSMVKFTPLGLNDLIRLKWYQVGDGGALYLKIYDDIDGIPGDQVYSKIITDAVDGWNTYDVGDEEFVFGADFWFGIKEFSSTMPIGLDTGSDAGLSYFSGDGGDSWEPISNLGYSGNLMIRVFLDEGQAGIGENLVIDDFALYPAYPNPFNPVTTISFNLETASSVSVTVYNVTGQLVDTIVSENMNAGYQAFNWNANNHPSGLYIVNVNTNDETLSQKVLLIK
ncbi:MAG: T9SS type A sorting domain-containing protein [Candidatus Marinimicrobia bacterium]|nr:T9SS type A sorting domain-containing protein [Candidatus Neomarinimicrobiota bacterium]MBL7046668.1 T9SS type A sorting domain-containing protein [Candidatus Neomarinimicrobiota bacterium]MBL7110233.1 T9SS type A sorting domain-containing protein [Candidatus Neomarinimicrobiota bacterium]